MSFGGLQPPVPFSQALELDHTLRQWQAKSESVDFCLPGHPRIGIEDTTGVLDCLNSDLVTSDLDRIEPWLWLVSTPSPQNISPLHRQVLRGRRIVSMEDPDLHMVWTRHQIFLKPLPAYLLSHAFWQEYLSPPGRGNLSQTQHLAQASCGLLRSYAYLIRHPSDFAIAQRDDLCLIPESISYDAFCKFIVAFEHLDADSVSPRYKLFGEIRLSRTNFLVKLLFRSWTFRETTSDYLDYFERFFGPLLFVFAVFSMLLNAMQVTLAVESLETKEWHAFWDVARWFAVTTIMVVVLLTGSMFLLLTKKLTSEYLYAMRMCVRRRYGTA
ncbi:hypothetical protein LTR10_008092 [Elasticomyces elasticus]|nr:hypothetical protein LTR10_008092 [Elasticomyces elasticus]KAK4971090.1 hypothetical protein LTR42_008069 [Elasticomyces elasticus]